MDYRTLLFVYSGMLLTIAGALVMTWRQNPNVAGPRSWAAGSVLGALALLFLTASMAFYAWPAISIWLFCVATFAASTRAFATATRRSYEWTRRYREKLWLAL